MPGHNQTTVRCKNLAMYRSISRLQNHSRNPGDKGWQPEGICDIYTRNGSRVITEWKSFSNQLTKPFPHLKKKKPDFVEVSVCPDENCFPDYMADMNMKLNSGQWVYRHRLL